MHVGGGHLESVEQLGPVSAHGLKSLFHRGGLAKALQDRADSAFVEDLGFGWVELVVPRVLPIAEQEDDRLLRPGIELKLDLLGADRLPTVGDRIRQPACLNADRVVPTSVGPRNASRCVSNPASGSEQAK